MQNLHANRSKALQNRTNNREYQTFKCTFCKYYPKNQTKKKATIMHLWLKTDFLILSMHAIVYNPTQQSYHQTNSYLNYHPPLHKSKFPKQTISYVYLAISWYNKKRSMHFFKKAVLSRLCKRLILGLWISVAIFWGQREMHFWLSTYGFLSMEFMAWFLSTQTTESLKKSVYLIFSHKALTYTSSMVKLKQTV